ncbi:MAG: hypothetical protein AB1758_30445, partial [Candidatus Eremiobacterota bacterium]
VDGAMGDLQKDLKKGAGVPGEVVGTVLRAPFFLIDQIAKGGKAVVDNTAGAVVDGVADVATRPTVHTHVVIPVDLSIQGGNLVVTPDGNAVRFSTARGDLGFDPLDLLPTRLLSNLIVNLVADAQGPTEVGSQARKQSVDVSLAGKGLSFLEVGTTPRPGGTPDLALKLQAGPGTAKFLADRLLPSGP